MEKHETLTEALAAFHADLPKVGKGALNPHFKSKYADLSDITAVVLPALAKHGLAWTTTPALTDRGFVLEYALTHVTGATITGEWPLPDPSTPAQQLGSALTYARRYTLSAVTGIAPDEDDDGTAAQQAARKTPEKATRVARAASALRAAKTLPDLDKVWADIEKSGLGPDLQKQFDERARYLTPVDGDAWEPADG